MADSPLNQPEELEETAALQRYPKLFVKISHSWSLSSAAYPYLDSQAPDQAAVRRLRPQAPDRRKRLAARREISALTQQAIDIARKRIDFLNC